jgi:hypothetical protein
VRDALEDASNARLGPHLVVGPLLGARSHGANPRS